MNKNIFYGVAIVGALIMLTGFYKLLAPKKNEAAEVSNYRPPAPIKLTTGKTIIVKGTDNWRNSEIKIKKGEPIQISASGTVTWATNKKEGSRGVVSPSGETYTGMDLEDTRWFILKNAHCGALLMRIGQNVQEVRTGGSFTASESGTIEFIVNDRVGMFHDNEGFFTVTVKTPVPIVTVKSDQAWNDTEITVKKGQQLLFRSSGEINLGSAGDAADKWITADGWGNIPSKSWLCNNQPCRYVNATNSLGSLIGKVGKTGKIFKLGISANVIAPETGILYLGVDDSLSDDKGNLISESELQKLIYSNNRGAFAVEIEVNN